MSLSLCRLAETERDEEPRTIGEGAEAPGLCGVAPPPLPVRCIVEDEVGGSINECVWR